jgi:hypothetical protein
MVVLAGLLLLLVLLTGVGAGRTAELVDPTRPALLPGASVGEPRGPNPSLQSIFISESQRVAVIGGRRVEVGDPVGDSRVVAIELSGVRLRGHDGEWLLTLTGRSPLEHGFEAKRDDGTGWGER